MLRFAGLLLLVCFSTLSLANDGKPPIKALVEEARLIAAEFQARLKPELTAALQEGGAVHAIEVCSRRAPLIAREISDTSSWQVRRVSLAPRNPSAQPDAWERQRLQEFDRAAAGGTEPVLASGMVDGGFRALQPLPVNGLCLTCHGKSVAPDVVTALERLYPADEATGYSLGQIRGAISLVAPKQE